MVALEVDFDIFKALTNRRATEDVTYNDVLRDILDLKPSMTSSPQGTTSGWSWKGVFLPNGTELRANFRGKLVTAKIENDKFIQDGISYNSPSAAAIAVTGYSVNGWWWWTVKRPTDASWAQLDTLRQR